MTRILAFTDPHGHLESAKNILELCRKERPDVIVCSGDFSFFGTRFEKFLDRLRELDQTVFYVNGNHETETTDRDVRTWYSFMQNLEYRSQSVAGIRIGGLPASGEYWPGEAADLGAIQSATALLSDAQSRDPFVLLSHYPPWMSSLAGYRVITPDTGGSRTVLRILDALKPALFICGHYHQDFGKTDFIGRTRLVNPGPDGMILQVPE